MARLFGRILSSIWDDEDFLALDDGEQRMYAFLLSQKNLNHAGLLPITLRKWTRKSRNSTRERLVAQLQALDAARFIVLDFDTEEVLVRTLVRNDSVYKQPRVMGAMVSDAREIESLRLRTALLAEIDRIPLDELNDKPGDKGQPSIRNQVAQHIADLHVSFGPLPTPPEPPRHPLDEPPLEDLDEPPCDPLYDEPPQEGHQGSTRVHTEARARALPYPVTPEAIPIPLTPLAPLASVSALPIAATAVEAAAPQGEDGALFAAPPPTQPKTAKSAKKPRKQRTPEEQARFDLAKSITDTWWDGLAKKPSGKNAWLAAEQIVEGLLVQDHAPEDVALAAKQIGIPMTINRIEMQLTRNAERQSRVVVPFHRPGHTAYRESDDREYRPLSTAFNTPGA